MGLKNHRWNRIFRVWAGGFDGRFSGRFDGFFRALTGVDGPLTGLDGDAGSSPGGGPDWVDGPWQPGRARKSVHLSGR